MLSWIRQTCLYSQDCDFRFMIMSGKVNTGGHDRSGDDEYLSSPLRTADFTPARSLASVHAACSVGMVLALHLKAHQTQIHA